MPDRLNQSEGLSLRAFAVLAVIAALLAAGALLPGLGGGFLLDDQVNIIENTSLHLLRPTFEDILYAAYSFQPGHGSRALSMLSFALDHWRAGGLDPQAFKVTNLLIHALSVLAVAAFFRRLLGMAGWPPRRVAVGALLMALLWGLHPLQVSSVLYVVQRMQTVCTLFVVLALWAYLGMRRAQMQGGRSRGHAVLTVLFGLLAFAGKEDAVLLPLHALALEMTLLRFRAASPLAARWWRRGYALFVAISVVVFLLYVLPRQWQWIAYPGRDYSSAERLLTQARVLVMYLWQMLLPLPHQLPFFYDDLPISRGLLQPATTLPALVLLLGLLAVAWRARARRPLFALGLLLFFTGHFLTSNVLGLELAFEHRNHFPLIGIVLAVSDLMLAAWQRWKLPMGALAGLAGAVCVLLATGTAVRAWQWGDPARFAQSSVAIAPRSERAWMVLNGFYADRSRLQAGSPALEQAVQVSLKGGTLTASPGLLSNVVIYRTIQGKATQADWDRFLKALRNAPMSPQNQKILWVTLNNVDRGIRLDERGVIATIEAISARSTFTASDYIRIGAYLHNETQSPGKGLPYLERAVALSPPGDPAIATLFAQLHDAGRDDWVARLKAVQPTGKAP